MLKRKKRGILYIVLLAGLVVLLCGSTVISTAVNSKYTLRMDYERLQNRYAAESAVNLCLGLFESYASKTNYAMTYTQNTKGQFIVLDDYSPYLLEDIRISDNVDNVMLELIGTESGSYLASLGFLGFQKKDGPHVECSIRTYQEKESFKLTRMCIEPDFLVGSGQETSQARSLINPVYLNIRIRYPGGEVFCTAAIENLALLRQPFTNLSEPGAMGTAKAWLDISKATVTIENYQNYKKIGGGLFGNQTQGLHAG